MFYLLKLNSIRTVFYEFLDHFYASYTKKILVEAIQLLRELWLYLVMGIVVSTVVKTFVSKDQMAGFFSRKTFFMPDGISYECTRFNPKDMQVK